MPIPDTVGGGTFLTQPVRAGDVFTREELSDEQRLFARTAEEFMRHEVLPREQQLYAHDWALTRELLRKAASLDLTRLEIPVAYGGLGLDRISAAHVGEPLAANPSFAGSIGAHTSIGTLPIVHFGTGEQKARYLPRLGSAELIGAYALTEPHSGSDARAARTTATPTADGAHYRLNGEKAWITNGGFADLFTIFAKVNGEHFTAFIVERAMGIVSGRNEPKLGLDGSSTTSLLLNDVVVPAGNVLGTVGEGHRVAFNVLNLGRVKLGTRNVSGAKRALDHAVRYAKDRRQFGRAICEFGLVRQKLGEMAIRCWVGDAMVYRALGDVDRALQAVPPDDSAAVLKTIETFAVECSINKVWTSEALAYVVDEAVQVFGGNGYSRDFPAERAYRDARITRIYEGTNEINRLIIATRMLKQLGEDVAPAVGSDLESPLVDERALLEAIRRVARTALRRAQDAWRDDLSEQQEVLGHIADIVGDVYACESAIARAEKAAARTRGDASIAAAHMARVYTQDAVDRVVTAGRRIVAPLASRGVDVADFVAQLRACAARPYVDTIAARRMVADAVINAARYPF